MLELAYYHRDLRSVPTDLLPELAAQDRLKRERGRRLLQSCPGNWRKRSVLHLCRPDHCTCASFEEAVEHVFGLLLLIGFHTLSVPSLIKWLSVWPLICDLTVMSSFHGVFLDGLRHAFEITKARWDADDREAGDTGDLSELSDSELLGMPQAQSSGTWHRQERRRALKVVRWFETPGTYLNMLLYLHTAAPVMKLHYSLFKHAQQSPFDDSKSYVFNLCDLKQSVAARVLADLASLLRSRSTATSCSGRFPSGFLNLQGFSQDGAISWLVR